MRRTFVASVLLSTVAVAACAGPVPSSTKAQSVPLSVSGSKKAQVQASEAHKPKKVLEAHKTGAPEASKPSSFTVGGVRCTSGVVVPDHVNVYKTASKASQFLSVPMLTVGDDNDGAAGTPPLTDKRSMAWYKLGPKVGSNKGKVLITTHTFHVGGASGNYMLAGARKPGGIVQFSVKGSLVRATRLVKLRQSE